MKPTCIRHYQFHHYWLLKLGSGHTYKYLWAWVAWSIGPCMLIYLSHVIILLGSWLILTIFSQLYHPDINRGHGEEEKFKEINAAYEMLFLLPKLLCDFLWILWNTLRCYYEMYTWICAVIAQTTIINAPI